MTRVEIRGEKTRVETTGGNVLGGGGAKRLVTFVKSSFLC